MTHIFISYSHDDAVFAERLAKDLKDAGFEVWIDFRGIQAGTEWENQIFKGVSGCEFLIVCLTPAAVGSDWVRREVLMARSQHKPVFPVLVKKQAETSAGVLQTLKLLLDHEETRKLSDIQMVDFERYGYELAFPMLLEGLPTRISPVSPDASSTSLDDNPTDIPNPFKGLEAFQQTDASLFFGREALIQKLLQRLSDQRADRFLAITGASGSGKSSLVRAGLIPQIRASALPESGSWPLIIFSPGPLPTESLSQRLLPVVNNYGLPASVLDVLKNRAEGLHVLTETLLNEAPRTARLVLVIDQFEEVFTRAKAIDAAHFLDLLVTAAAQPDGRTLIILTMRADFFDRLSAYRDLANLFEQDNLVIATELAPEELRRSIEKPAEVVGLAYEHGLVDTILEDVRQQPGSLPLLQYALKQLYEARQGRWLKTEAYTVMGGVRGALAGHADTIFNQLLPNQQDLMRRLLVRLVEVSVTGEATRRRVNREHLTFSGVDSAQITDLVDLLAAPDNRLLVANREVTAASDNAPVTVEISHEALVREWPKLRDWIKEDEANLQYGGELLKDAQDWDKHDRDPEFLLQGERRVLLAQLWLEKADASDLQRDFVTNSGAELQNKIIIKAVENTKMVEFALEAETNARRAEAAERDRATRFQRAAQIAGVLVLMAIVGIIAALWTVNEATKRSDQADQALATAQFSSTLSAFDEHRLKTRIPGLGQIPPTPLATLLPVDAFAMATQIANAYGHDDDVIKTFDHGVEMVQVPAGCFFMGSNFVSDAIPINQVCFEKAFWIDRFEVTNEQFDGLKGQADQESYFCDSNQDKTITPEERAGCAQRPRESVTWFEASSFCQKKRMIGTRLPTEAEWEYAAAGPDSYPYPWGREFPQPNVEDYAVFNQKETADVGAGLRDKGRSWVGAYDMSGSVSEWVSTLYNDYPYPVPGSSAELQQWINSNDKNNNDTNNIRVLPYIRVLRGGSWFGNNTDFFRCDFRFGNIVDNGDYNYGFRCARSSEP